MIPLLVAEIMTEYNDIEEDTKPLWEVCYDFYKKNEKYILGGLLVGQVAFMGYNIFNMRKEINNLKKIDDFRVKDLKELEMRIEKQSSVLKKMDEENSKINMWFSQAPKIEEPKRAKFYNRMNIK